MRVRLLLTMMAIVVAVSAGCGTSAPARLETLPKATRLKSGHERPLRYSVAFAPIVPGQMQKPKATFAAAVKADTGTMRNELAKTLRDFEVFKELKTIEAATEAEALELAKKEGTDLLLTASLVRYNVAYDRGTRGALTVVFWLFSPWLSWSVRDEVYSADIGLHMTLRRVRDGTILWQKLVAGKGSCELNDVQRGLKTHEYFVGSIFTGPSSFDRNNYQKVASVVGPHAMQDLQLALVGELYQLPQPPPDKKSFAIVVGVNATGVAGLPKLEYAEADAAAFAKALGKSASPFSEMKVLAGKEATLEGLRGAIEDFKTREFVEITDFLVYFAGPGASIGARHYLAFSDSKDARSMLSLEELHSLVEGVKARSRVVVLDTGFAGEGSRGLVLGGGVVAAFDKTLAQSITVATITGCGPDQGGHEFAKLGHGVFTARLVQALAGPADINEDKTITVEELVTSVDWDVQRYVRDNTVGQSQKPALVCGGKLAGWALLKVK